MTAGSRSGPPPRCRSGFGRTWRQALAIPEAAVRVIVPDFGGGFGGKHAGEVALEAARLARAVGAPVKVRWSREEEFRHGYVRPAAVIDIRVGAGRDGRLTAWQMTNLNSGSFGLAGPYEVPNQRLDYQAADSPLRQGSYRGLAATANHFARESAMDEAAVALEIDPLELRLAHLRDERLAAAFRAVAGRIDWTRERQQHEGVGIAGGIEKDARVVTAVELQVGEDRRPVLTRIVTAFDCGRIVNPDALTNQIQGAISMGLGGALFEAVHFERGGVLTNASLTDYRVPRITDLPAIEVVLLDRPDVPSAGAGETPIIALAPAIANAIFDATGVRLRDMPLIPDGWPSGMIGLADRDPRFRRSVVHETRDVHAVANPVTEEAAMSRARLAAPRSATLTLIATIAVLLLAAAPASCKEWSIAWRDAARSRP